MPRRRLGFGWPNHFGWPIIVFVAFLRATIAVGPSPFLCTRNPVQIGGLVIMSPARPFVGSGPKLRRNQARGYSKAHAHADELSPQSLSSVADRFPMKTTFALENSLSLLEKQFRAGSRRKGKTMQLCWMFRARQRMVRGSLLVPRQNELTGERAKGAHKPRNIQKVNTCNDSNQKGKQ